jgi:glycosyltransferase involved in cell wall biosynthesis
VISIEANRGIAETQVPRKILHVSTRFLRGGAERNMANVIRWESSRGHDVHLAVGGNIETAIPGATQIHRIAHLGRSVRPISDVRAALELRALIRRERFDVVHTHESKAGALGRLAGRGSGAVVVHTVHMPSFGSAYGRICSQAFRTVERFCARTTDIFIVVGEELRDIYLASGIGDPDQYLTLRSPIEIDRFVRLRGGGSSAVGSARVRLGMNPDIPVAVSIGRLERRKRQAFIISGLRDMVIAGRLQLLIAGEGPEEQRLRELARRNGTGENVFFVGYVEELDDVFLAADVLVHASRVEGVPQVVLQALAAGVPVVATSVEGLYEVREAPIARVRPDGSSLSSEVENMLRNPPRPVPVACLDKWRASAIARSVEALDSRITAIAKARMQ